jgi:hypothetical protein
MATTKKTTVPRKYHVVLTDGTERTITASSAESSSGGALMLFDADGDVRVSYAPGTWTYVELETQDD